MFIKQINIFFPFYFCYLLVSCLNYSPLPHSLALIGCFVFVGLLAKKLHFVVAIFSFIFLVSVVVIVVFTNVFVYLLLLLCCCYCYYFLFCLFHFNSIRHNCFTNVAFCKYVFFCSFIVVFGFECGELCKDLHFICKKKMFTIRRSFNMRNKCRVQCRFLREINGKDPNNNLSYKSEF